MKKYLVSILAAVALVPMNAQALVGFGLEAGYASWSQSATGSMGGTNVGPTSSSPGMLWLEAEHPVPLLPNLRYGSANMSVGDATNGLNLATTDTVVYWNPWDTLFTIDFGLGVRSFVGDVTIAGLSSTLPGAIPVTYYNLAGKIPGLDLTVGYRYTGLSGSGQGVTSTEMYVNYSFAFGLGVTAGMRDDAITFDSGGTGIDISGGGMFIGVMYKLD
ncbi:MAG: TIGR04219 family outer membrane beta-barrel protein [Gammaproteobacteria bacterium]|nr:TIGR04219 family outer membrane beta-barrel protein [Gammaproteobacteria bacterium]